MRKYIPENVQIRAVILLSTQLLCVYLLKSSKVNKDADGRAVFMYAMWLYHGCIIFKMSSGNER